MPQSAGLTLGVPQWGMRVMGPGEPKVAPDHAKLGVQTTDLHNWLHSTKEANRDSCSLLSLLCMQPWVIADIGHQRLDHVHAKSDCSTESSQPTKSGMNLAHRQAILIRGRAGAV